MIFGDGRRKDMVHSLGDGGKDIWLQDRLMVGDYILTDRRMDTIGCMVEGKVNGWLLLAVIVQ
jgi:hypothetical protein